MEYVVLGVQSWELPNEKTGKDDIVGISVHYIDPASPADSEDSIGIFPAKLTADKKLMEKFTTLPGRYKFDIGLKRIAGGKTGVELNSVEYVGSVSFAGSSNSSPTVESSSPKPQSQAARESLETANSQSNAKIKL